MVLLVLHFGTHFIGTLFLYFKYAKYYDQSFSDSEEIRVSDEKLKES